MGSGKLSTSILQPMLMWACRKCMIFYIGSLTGALIDVKKYIYYI